MSGRPTTLEQARRYRYGTWAGHPKGNAFTEGDCIAEFMPNERGAISRQCGRKPQPGKLWCSLHDPALVKARGEKIDAEYREHESVSGGNEKKARALGKRLGAGTMPHYHSASSFKDSGYREFVCIPFALAEAILRDLGR